MKKFLILFATVLLLSACAGVSKKKNANSCSIVIVDDKVAHTSADITILAFKESAEGIGKQHPDWNLNQIDSAAVMATLDYAKKHDRGFQYVAPLFQLIVLHSGEGKYALTDSIMHYALSDMDKMYANGPEVAHLNRSAILYFRAMFLCQGDNTGLVTYGPWQKKYDMQLRAQEKRFEDFLDQQTTAGNYPKN